MNPFLEDERERAQRLEDQFAAQDAAKSFGLGEDRSYDAEAPEPTAAPQPIDFETWLKNKQNVDAITADAGPAPTPAQQPSPSRTPAIEATESEAPAESDQARVRRLLMDKYGLGDNTALLEAQRDASEARGSANMGRAVGTLIQGISGGRAKVDDKTFDSLENQADQGVKDLATQRAATSERLKNESQINELTQQEVSQDPSSEINKSFQGFLTKMLPGLANTPGLGSITLANAGPFEKLAAAFMQAEQARQSRADMMELRKMGLGIQKQGKDATQARFDRADLRDLQKQIPDSAARVEEILKRIDKNLGGIDNVNSKKDIQGVGPLESLNPFTVLMSSKAGEVRQDAIELVRQMLQIQSGQTVTEQEARAKAISMGLGPGSAERVFRRGVQNVRNEIAAALRKKQAGYSPHTVDTFKQQGGISDERVMAIGKKPTALSPRDQEAIDWAKANPNEPQADAILKLHGLK